MRLTKIAALVAFAGVMSACAPVLDDKGFDQGVDSKELGILQAGIWVDPTGCDHWIIDDGVEGYLSQRLDKKTGRPVCSGIAPPNTVTGPFKDGSAVPDLL
ncbi:MAG: hypothetical protein AB3N13_08010 [Arenibacterium sp.]